MIIDIHVHEKEYSLDSHISLVEIVAEARRKGLDGVCITDHESNGLAAQARIYRQECGYPVLVGAEILTCEGDILVFGLERLPTQKVHAWELLALVARQGGVGIAAHPYRNNMRGLGDKIKKLSNLDGFEVLSGRSEPENNIKSFKVAQRLGLTGFGGSDAHELYEVGKYATYFSQQIKDEADFIKAVKYASYEPVFYSNGTYKRLTGGLGNENEKVAGFAVNLDFNMQCGGMRQEY